MHQPGSMKVQKRDGSFEDVSFDKVLNRIKTLSNGLTIEPVIVAQKVCSRIYDGVTTSALDELSCEICTAMMTEHIDYGTLASRLVISNHHKNTSPSFSEVVNELHTKTIMLDDTFFQIVMKNREKLNASMKYDRDYLFDYFGFKTLEKGYLLKIGDRVVERPQHMFMRVALAIHGDDIKSAIETYDSMSQRLFIHATPTLFNSGTKSSQFSSCFLLEIDDDSVDGIYKTIRDCANISKYAGGIGLHLSKIRAKNSLIKSSMGKSNGIVPLLRVLNNTARHITQSGKRQGSIAVYLEPWHADVFDFLDMKKNHGNEEERARDLFYALWVPDAFMNAVKTDSDWYLMSPDMCPGLQDAWGESFDSLYNSYVADGKFLRKIKARELWTAILTAQIETGSPYLLFKDNVNKKSNQMNLGTIKSSNLCCEITEYTSKDEQAVCNLASLVLPSFIHTDDEGYRTFSHDQLANAVRIVTRNLNKIIDKNFYPTKETRNSNFRHRPIGIGIQGLADVFAILRLPFDSPEANDLNQEIFETIYFAALQTSMEISKERTIALQSSAANLYMCPEEEKLAGKSWAGAYSSFEGSPASKGILQFDMWNVSPSPRWNWTELKENIMIHGLRNSLLVAPMPTASTSQIMGYNECFEPFTSNLYSRRTLAGEFIVINKYLVKDLMNLGLWSIDMKNKIIKNNGSVQSIAEIPANIKALYKTVWEIKQRTLIDMSAARGAFICQSQSLNIFMENPNHSKLTSCHFYAWEKGLKTGQYYLRTRSISKAQQFTIEPEKLNASASQQSSSPSNRSSPKKPTQEEILACSRENPEACALCSS